MNRQDLAYWNSFEGSIRLLRMHIAALSRGIERAFFRPSESRRREMDAKDEQLRVIVAAISGMKG